MYDCDSATKKILVHMVKLLLHHINKIDDAIINCTVDLEALLHNLRNAGAPYNIGQAKTSCKNGTNLCQKRKYLQLTRASAY
jgi:hypothetical protein